MVIQVSVEYIYYVV